MKIAYITAHAPFGQGEAFIIEEMLALLEAGADLIIIPRNPPKEVFHGEAYRLLANTIWLPLLDLRMLTTFVKALLLQPCIWRVIGQILRYSRSFKMMAKNLAVLPKATFVARLLERERAEHIHAHWGSTTSTMAWVISELTGIPWSMTLHRWDIAENNLLKLKIAKAVFTRCISEDGRMETLKIVGEEFDARVKVLHIGVKVPSRKFFGAQKTHPEFIIACPANLVPKKGHRFLVQACALLIKAGIRNFRCLIIGDGPLQKEIKTQIAQHGLSEIVHMVGRLPHEAIIQMYEKGEVDAVVLPSIITEDGEREGIPVTLMEAMAYSIPVISTGTGGIPELICEDAGILVQHSSAESLAQAIRKLLEDESLRAKLASKGRERIEREFNLDVNVRVLLDYMNSAGV